MEPDYNEWKNQNVRTKLPTEVATERHREQSRRSATAQRRALKALSYLHPDDYRRFYQAARAEVEKERGLLPGDRQSHSE